MTKYVILTESQCYGMGDTIQLAAANARAAGAHRSDPVLAYLYIGEPEELKSVCITPYGDIEHPECVISTRLFGPKDSAVKLRHLLNTLVHVSEGK